MKKVGILGGTFNPIHIGHLMLAEQAYEEFHLDEVLVMPSGISYLKKNLNIPDGRIRSEMVSLAISDNPHLTLSDIEVKRAGNTYTSETLVWLKDNNSNTEYYFIIGADTLFSIENWRNVPVIFENCICLVSVRNDSPVEQLQIKIAEYEEKYHAKIHLLHMPNIEVSSENIRKRVYEGKSIRYYVPPQVEQYIREQNLYTI